MIGPRALVMPRWKLQLLPLTRLARTPAQDARWQRASARLDGADGPPGGPSAPGASPVASRASSVTHGGSAAPVAETAPRTGRQPP
ncbi:hypothetical protein AB0A81_24480 [Streptomyces flaveolus]|uniref:hypothetical protein n=1 Tax=Streptomyces flaveolus TaxID=67297 RepID=UPI0033C94689